MNSFNLNITGEALSLKKKLLPGLNRIGSKSNNDIVIEHPFICPQHFHIQINDPIEGNGFIYCVNDQFKISIMSKEFLKHEKNLTINSRHEFSLKDCPVNFIIKNITFVIEMIINNEQFQSKNFKKQKINPENKGEAVSIDKNLNSKSNQDSCSIQHLENEQKGSVSKVNFLNTDETNQPPILNEVKPKQEKQKLPKVSKQFQLPIKQDSNNEHEVQPKLINSDSFSNPKIEKPIKQKEGNRERKKPLKQNDVQPDQKKSNSLKKEKLFENNKDQPAVQPLKTKSMPKKKPELETDQQQIKEQQIGIKTEKEFQNKVRKESDFEDSNQLENKKKQIIQTKDEQLDKKQIEEKKTVYNKLEQHPLGKKNQVTELEQKKENKIINVLVSQSCRYILENDGFISFFKRNSIRFIPNEDIEKRQIQIYVIPQDYNVRSYKLLLSITYGAEIVHIQWLLDCFHERLILPRMNYFATIILDDVKIDLQSIYEKSQQKIQLLFKDIQFQINEKEDFVIINQEQIRFLIILNGGEITNKNQLNSVLITNDRNVEGSITLEKFIESVFQQRLVF